MAGADGRFRKVAAAGVPLLLAILASLPAGALPTLANLGGDPYSNTTSQHATQVEIGRAHV